MLPLAVRLFGWWVFREWKQGEKMVSKYGSQHHSGSINPRLKSCGDALMSCNCQLSLNSLALFPQLGVSFGDYTSESVKSWGISIAFTREDICQ